MGTSRKRQGTGDTGKVDGARFHRTGLGWNGLIDTRKKSAVRVPLPSLPLVHSPPLSRFIHSFISSVIPASIPSFLHSLCPHPITLHSPPSTPQDAQGHKEGRIETGAQTGLSFCCLFLFPFFFVFFFSSSSLNLTSPLTLLHQWTPPVSSTHSTRVKIRKVHSIPTGNGRTVTESSRPSRRTNLR